jgi:uncharacterized protein (DUF608 family)
MLNLPSVEVRGVMAERESRDEHGCRNSGLPLGGIGAGSLEIRPDGCFYEWNLMNNRPWGAAANTDAMERHGLRFGARFDLGEGPRCLALSAHHGLDPKEDGWFWLSDPYHLPWVQHASNIRYRASIPFAELAYEFDDMPLEIGLTAWSPLIPHQPDDSNTPGALLVFRIANPTDRPCRVALTGLLKNAVGHDRPDLPSTCEPVEGEPAGFVFGRAGTEAGATTDGTLALLAHTPLPHEVSRAVHPRHGRDLWDALLRAGRLENRDWGAATAHIGEIGAERETEGAKGTQRAALCLSFTVGPGAEAECTFLLTWHFPNFRELDYRDTPGECIGVQYATRFPGAVEVARWLWSHRRRLEEQTRRFHAAFYETSLPAWERDAINAALSVLLRSCWWDRRGRFGVWEGLGCCGLQTIDVGHYGSLPILQLFPRLDAALNRLSAANCEPSGKVPHLMPGQFGRNDYKGGRGRIDLCAQFALAVWRHVLWTGDLEFGRALWPVVERNVALLEQTDTDGDGLPNNEGPDQTYDRFPLYGTSAYVGLLYLAGLRAACDLGQWLGQADPAARYRVKAERAAGELDRQLWNGSCYNLSCQSGQGTSNGGCMADQVNGDWFYRQSSGRGLLDDQRVRTALATVVRRNRRTGGPQAWLANCTWPEGRQQPAPSEGSDQANCPWSGVEYAVAAHMILMGMVEQGRQVAWDVFNRYEAAGMRFNHVECGEYYYRAMSAWALLAAEFGIAYDGLQRRLRVVPPAEDAKFLVCAPSGYAQALWRQKERTLELRVLGGTLDLAKVTVRGEEADVRPGTLSEGDQIAITLKT